MDLMGIRRGIILNEPHQAVATGDFITDLKAPAAVSGASGAYVRNCGKNLFDTAVGFANPSDTTVANSTKRYFTPFTYALGAGWSNYFAPAQILSYSISAGNISVVSKAGYGIGFAFPLKAGDTYILSCRTNGYGLANVVWYRADGSYISYGGASIINTAVTIPSNAVMTVYIFAEKSELYGAQTAVFSDIQLEKASAATTYEAYSGADSYGPASITTKRGLNSILTNGSGVSIKYWTH